MSYFIYLLSFILLACGLISFLKPQKIKRIIHILAYLFPFWIWGFILIVFSMILWQYKEEKIYSSVITIFAFLFLVKGIFLIFYPKRKIKKTLEKWENLPKEIKKIQSIIFIIIAFLFFIMTK